MFQQLHLDRGIQHSLRPRLRQLSQAEQDQKRQQQLAAQRTRLYAPSPPATGRVIPPRPDRPAPAPRERTHPWREQGGAASSAPGESGRIRYPAHYTADVDREPPSIRTQVVEVDRSNIIFCFDWHNTLDSALYPLQPFDQSIWFGGHTRPKPGFTTLLGAWWQAAAARKHLTPARRQVRNPIKNDFGGHTRPKPGFAILLGAWWQAAAARRHLKPARRQVRNPIKNDFGGHKRPKPVTWALCHLSWGLLAGSQKPATRTLCHPSWGLVAGCSCTEAFGASLAAGSKPDKKWLWRPYKAEAGLCHPSWGLVAGCSCTDARIWSLPDGRFETR